MASADRARCYTTGAATLVTTKALSPTSATIPPCIKVLAAFQTPIGFVVFTDNLDDDASFCPIKQIENSELTDMQAVFLVPNHPLMFDNIGILG
jgi:hypothetical protein